MLDDDTMPGLDPTDTLSQFRLCRFTRYGCHTGVRWWAGQDEWARAYIVSHEKTCLYRFGPDPT